jgi:hypothetical protein
MIVDTLLLSGCSTKGNAIIGSLMTLVNNKILDLEKIKTYICCSGGAIIGLLLCCGYSLSFIYRLSLKIDYKTLLNIDDLNILFDNCGLFDNIVILELVEKILYKKFKQKNITLKQLYDKTGKNYTLKVFNLTEKKSEYISYKTHPDLSVSKSIQMTTCIPVLFKPIRYNECYYLDGGLTGNMVYSEDHKNYIGIYITTRCECDIETINIVGYIQLLSNSIFEKYEFDVKNNPRIVNLDIFKDLCFDFDIDHDKKNEFIEKSIHETLNHIKKYKL